MAESTSKKAESKDQPQNQESVVHTSTADTQAAQAAGVSEGDIKAMRHNAGLNQLAGHEANVHAWEASAAGQEFLAGEKDRQKQAEQEAKAIQDARGEEGLTSAEATYVEALGKARKG